jgi:hypothetical protein
VIGATGHRADGYRAPPCRDRRDAGLTTTALLHHFPIKQQLLVAVLASGTGPLHNDRPQSGRPLRVAWHEPHYPGYFEGWGHFGGDAKPSIDGQMFSYLADAVVPIEHELP